MTSIEIYPEILRPDWLELGCDTYCQGEANEIYTVTTIAHLAAFLTNKRGLGHGWESYGKLGRVYRVELYCFTCGKKEIINYHSEKVNLKDLPDGWYHYLGGKVFNCYECVLETWF